MLVELISESLIQLDIEASSPEEAIRQAAYPLVQEGMIEERYVDGIIKALNNFGPYFVLLPHVALPHTRAEEGAVKNAIGISTLKNPICFGNSDNNPVKYIFFLSAMDNEKHIDAMGELLELMNNPVFLSLLDQSNDREEFMHYLDNYLCSNK